MNQTASRCPWPVDDLYRAYHDREWGVPLHDDRALFEFLVLEGAQAGLSWHIVLKKRPHYRAVFDQFDPQKVARYTPARINRLLANLGLIRNRLKIASAVRNDRTFLAVQEEFGSFDRYIWRFVDGSPIVHHYGSIKEVPARSRESDAISKDLKQRGFNFIGSTICYAHMQATGMVNDHLLHCFRHRQLAGG